MVRMPRTNAPANMERLMLIFLISTRMTGIEMRRAREGSIEADGRGVLNMCLVWS